MSERRLVSLAARYPHMSRMTRWRIRQEPDFPQPIVLRGREYYDEGELTAWEELHRGGNRKNRRGK